MSATTPLGITSPCSGETINSAVLQTYAETTQAAIAAQQATADDALYPPAAQVRRTNNLQNFTAGVSAQMTWDVEAYDPDNLFVLGTGTITVTSAGTYLISAQTRNSSQPVNFTSIRVAILINGVEVAANKSDAGSVVNTVNDRVSASLIGVALAVGTTVTVNFLYTGAASPMGVDGTFTVTRAATV